MSVFNDEHILNPEVEFWVLHNKHTNQQHVISWDSIINTFGQTQAQKMLNGFHDYWDVYRYYKN